MSNPLIILISVLSIYIIKFITESILLFLNYSFIRKNGRKIPEFVADRINGNEFDKTVSYNLDKHKFAFVSSLFSVLLMIIILSSGILGSVENMVFRIGFQYRINQFVYIGIVSMFFTLSGIPFDIYNNFRLEARYGFNTMTWKTYISDFLKKGIINLIIMIPLLYGIFRFVELSAYWWLFAFAAISLFQLIIYLLYPVFIAPLFNKYKPLPDGELKEKLSALAAKTGFKMNGIFIMDGSKRSRHSNAFFYGLGAKKRIVLFDTLIDKLSAEQIEAVLAHEIGHYRKKHVLKNLAISLLLNLAGLFVLSRLISWQDLFIAFGYSGTSLHAALVLFAFCSEPLFFFIKPLFSMWSRKYEYEADSFAREQLGSGDALAQALLQLGLDNKSNLTVHPAYSFFYYSHPALPERIKAIE